MVSGAKHLNEIALQCIEILHYVQNDMALQSDTLSTAFFLWGVTYFGALARVLVGWKPTVITQNALKRVGAPQRALARFALGETQPRIVMVSGAKHLNETSWQGDEGRVAKLSASWVGSDL